MSTKPNHARIYRKVPGFLKHIREQAGLTQRQLAKKIGQSQWWIARSELGERRLDVAEFIAICRGCDLDPTQAIQQLETWTE